MDTGTRGRTKYYHIQVSYLQRIQSLQTNKKIAGYKRIFRWIE